MTDAPTPQAEPEVIDLNPQCVRALRAESMHASMIARVGFPHPSVPFDFANDLLKHIDTLSTHITALHAKLAAAEGDAGRLDWLDGAKERRNHFSLRSQGYIEHDVEFRIFMGGIQDVIGANVRECIDAAIQHAAQATEGA